MPFVAGWRASVPACFRPKLHRPERAGIAEKTAFDQEGYQGSAKRPSSNGTPVVPATEKPILIGTGILRKLATANVRRLEVEDNSGGEAGIVLATAEEAGLQVVPLEAPCHAVNEAVVEAASDSGGEGSIGTGDTRATGANVSDTDQQLGERPEVSDRSRQARAEQHVVFAPADLTRRAGRPGRQWANDGNVCTAVVAAEVCHDAQKWKDFAFERTFPAVEIRAPAGSKIATRVGVSKKDIALRNLGCSKRCQCEKEKW